MATSSNPIGLEQPPAAGGDFWSGLFSSDFLSQGLGYRWQPEIVWTHVVADSLIATAYLSILGFLLAFLAKRRDVSLHWMFVLVAAFIFACATSHVLDVITVWNPIYRLDAMVKVITALVSIAVAIGLIPLLPKALSLPNLWQVNSRLEQAHEELQRSTIDAAQAAKELRERTADLQFMADTMAQIVWTARADGNLDYYNKRWFDYTGMTIEQTKDWGWKPVLHPDDLEQCVARWTHAFTTGEEYEVEYRFKRASDGVYRWHLGRARPLRDSQGKVIKWFGTCTDIHDHKIATERLLAAQSELEEQVEIRTKDLALTNIALRTSEERYRSVVHAANAAIITADRHGIVRSWNPGAERMFGWLQDETIGKPVTLIIPLRFREAHLAGLLRISNGAASKLVGTNTLLDGMRKDGSEFKLEMTLGSWQTEDGPWFTAVLMDVSERIGIEKALRNSEEHYRRLVETADEGIWSIDADNRTTFVNKKMADLLHCTVESMLGRPMDDYMDEEGRRIAAANIEHRKQGKSDLHDFKFQRGDGSVLWAIISTTPLTDDQGGYAGALGMVTDITERKRAQDELATQLTKAAEFENLVELAPTPMVIAGTDGYFLRLNQAWVDVLGWSKHDLTSQPYLSFVHPDDLEPTLKIAEHLAEGQSAFSFENRYRAKDGSYRHFVWMAWFEPSNQRIYAVAHDLTKHKLMEAELNLARQAAEAAANAKSSFLATMSHEIRTPMNGIIGMVSVLQETSLSAVQQEQVEIISQSADSLLTIVNDILDFSKIEAGLMTLEAIPFDLRSAVADVIGLVQPQAQSKLLRLTFEIASNIPVTVLGDPGRLRQVLLNLLGNAIKFTAAGSVRLTVEVSHTDSSTIIFAIYDTGIGIPAEKASLLFQRFVQVDSSTTRHFGGSGLGLAICKSLVELMKGTISVQSEKGQGSVFRFNLRLPETVALVAEPPSLSSNTSNNFGYRVLVAEDNTINQKVAAMHLKKLGCSVDLAGNGLEAVDLARRFPYNLIVMDCQMPQMDGYEATRQIRKFETEIGKRTPIVALSANALPEDVVRSMSAGMDDHLSKPFYLDDIRRLLMRLQKVRSGESESMLK